MKNTTYSIGIICLIVILIGAIFKIMHLPGAGISIMLGLGSLSLIFLPMAYFQALKSTTDSLLKLVYHAAFFSFFIDFVGMIFKIMHWPGASWLMLVGIPLPFVLFLPLYIFYHNKRKLKADGSFFSILLFMLYLGIFSSLLAINFGSAYLNSFVRIANITNTSSLNMQQYTSTRSVALNDQLEEVKKNIASYVNHDNTMIMHENYNYSDIKSKQKIVDKNNLYYSGVVDFYSALDAYKEDLKPLNEIQKRLFLDIEIYKRSGVHNSYGNRLESLPLISTLNILNDWQNKISLIDYVKQSDK